jgi:hypothetical protein
MHPKEHLHGTAIEGIFPSIESPHLLLEKNREPDVVRGLGEKLSSF